MAAGDPPTLEGRPDSAAVAEAGSARKSAAGAHRLGLGERLGGKAGGLRNFRMVNPPVNLYL